MPMNRDIVVIGASAGGVEALSSLVRGLPADLPAAVFVVLHVPASGTSVLPAILQRAGRLPAGQARDGEPIRRGRIYVAPADHHLLIRDGHVELTHGPSENGHRPAVDPLFRSAARAGGPRVIGVVLSGMLDDGTAGLLAIKREGGAAVVQDPEDALFDGMPRSAEENVPVDHVVPVAEMGPLLARLAREPLDGDAEEDPPVSDETNDRIEREVETAEMVPRALDATDGGHPGAPSSFACPDCGGVLWEIEDGEFFRFRCRTGHAYTAETLLSEQADALDEALWTALRALEESAELSRRLAERARQRGQHRAEPRFQEQAREASARAAVIRQALMRDGHKQPA